MAVSALSVVCIFALAIVGVAVGCNMSVCCCPIGEVKMTQSGTTVSYSFSLSKPCNQQVNSQCQLEGDVCNDPDDSLSATKTGGEVIVSVEEDSRCDSKLSCTTDSCKNTDNWAGVYDVSGSGVVVVSAVCLLTTMLLGMFL
jgi:hypothetical protein